MNNLRTRQRTDSNLKQQFFIKSALLLVGGCLLISALTYWNTRRLLMEEAMTKSEVILREVEAVRWYVQDELRPKMYDLHGADTFIIEAMSTTYVSATIMERFGKSMPDYVYRRASVNPHNPRNLADSFEEEMIDWFEQNPSKGFWQGIVKKNGKDVFVSMVPDYFTAPCIRCHGKVQDAPRSLVERYGKVGGFRFKAGDLAGIDSISLPVSQSLGMALHGSIILFAMMLVVTFLWLWLFNLLFRRLVVERLGAMLLLVSGKGADEKTVHGDELDVLRDSVGSLHKYVQSAQKGASLQPNFIKEYVVGRPLAAGAMSWLYKGASAVTEKKVCLKIGFSDALNNPLYLACFQAETRLFVTLKHRAIPRVLERLDEVLVLDEVTGDNLNTFIHDQPLSAENTGIIFSQICDLVGSLHAQGIVHHDLRPEIFLLRPDKHLFLTDMGLASSDLLPDPIAAAGLGPQGELCYMAPELIKGRRGDSRSDIYSLGVFLFFVTTGFMPFKREKISFRKWLQRKEEFVIAQHYLELMSEERQRIIKKAMAYDSNNRYQWVEDFWQDLEQEVAER